MSIAEDMIAIADDMMLMLGVPATYIAQGSVLPGVAVTVRCKPKRTMTQERGRMLVMEISVRATEVETPAFGDTFEIGGESWKLSSLPLEFYEISSHAMGALWQLVLIKDAVSTGRGGA